MAFLDASAMISPLDGEPIGTEAFKEHLRDLSGIDPALQIAFGRLTPWRAWSGPCAEARKQDWIV